MRLSLSPAKALLIVFTAVLPACSIYSLPEQQEAPPPPASTVPVPNEPEQPVTSAAPPPAPVANESTASQTLLDRAQRAAHDGDYDQALALLERAQRIDPDSGAVYLALAQTYAKKGDTAMAQATAQRGLLYCNGSRQCRALRKFL